MTSIPLSQAKTHLAKLLAEVQELGEEVVITRSGRPAAVLVSYEEYEGMLETLEILADQGLAKAIRRGLEEAARGDTMGHQDVWDGLDDPLHP
ncbi:MAG TPA: type II toxin-antitoxin system Phd/YefM family antitoxin [Acidobacteriota bacterium]|jgi:prevent-host-death family protein